MAKRQNKFKEKSFASYQRTTKSIEIRQGKKDPLIVLSFKDFDRTQGQSFENWEAEQLLALAVEKLAGICQKTVRQATAEQIITPYTKIGFPPTSGFYHPKHIHPEVIWSSMHIQGKECVIGYFDDNIFHVVFLDKEHEFWKTKKKNT